MVYFRWQLNQCFNQNSATLSYVTYMRSCAVGPPAIDIPSTVYRFGLFVLFQTPELLIVSDFVQFLRSVGHHVFNTSVHIQRVRHWLLQQHWWDFYKSWLCFTNFVCVIGGLYQQYYYKWDSFTCDAAQGMFLIDLTYVRWRIIHHTGITTSTVYTNPSGCSTTPAYPVSTTYKSSLINCASTNTAAGVSGMNYVRDTAEIDEERVSTYMKRDAKQGVQQVPIYYVKDDEHDVPKVHTAETWVIFEHNCQIVYAHYFPVQSRRALSSGPAHVLCVSKQLHECGVRNWRAVTHRNSEVCVNLFQWTSEIYFNIVLFSFHLIVPVLTPNRRSVPQSLVRRLSPAFAPQLFALRLSP